MTEIFEYPQIIFDTETTGIKGGRVIEIGAVVIDTSGEVVSEFDTLVWQSRDILYSPRSAEALSINNIDREEVLNSGISEQEAGEKFAKWIAESKENFGAKCMRAYNQQFDFDKIRRPPLDPFMHDGGSIPEGECIMMASYKLMHKAGKLVKLPWKDQEADLYGYPEDDIGRYKWPSASEAVTYFASLGYYIPDEVEHRALPDARREAAIAVAIKCEEIGSGPISNTKETVIRPPDVRNTMPSLTLGLAASQCTTFGRDRYDQLVKSTAEFIVSPFSAENPSDWAMDYVHAPEGGGLTDEAWLEKYGLDRMHLLEKTRLLLEGIERMYQELWVCPVCGTLEAGEGEPVTIAGGRIRNTAGGGEHGGFQRCGCDTCDYELNYETF